MEILIPIFIILFLSNNETGEIKEIKETAQAENITSKYDTEEEILLNPKISSQTKEKEERHFKGDHLYFFQNNYNLEIIKERDYGNIIKKESIYNINIDSSEVFKITNKSNKNNNYTGTIFKIQLIPKTTSETDFTFLYDFSINEMQEQIKAIDNGIHFKQEVTRVKKEVEQHSEIKLDYVNEKKIKADNYIITFRLYKTKSSNKFKNPNKIKCSTNICKKMVENTMKIKTYLNK